MDKEYYRETFSKDDLKILARKYKKEEDELWESYMRTKEKVEMLESLILEDT